MAVHNEELQRSVPALLHWILSLLVWAEIGMVYVVLPKESINQIKPIQQSSLLLNIYCGLNYEHIKRGQGP